jgi:histone-lysine N-methyltransferase SETMAR
VENKEFTSAEKACMSRSQVKTMLVCFFDHKGIVHNKFIAQGHMVNQHCYLEVLTRLRECVRKKRPRLWPGKWILHHDNSPAHDVLRVREFLAKNSITKMDHPPYSPELAPCDFWLFPKLKNALKGQRFADLSDIQHNVKK